MNKDSNIKFVNGWMGGHYEVNVKEFSKYELYLKEVSGTDYDHGHEYGWTASRLQIKVKTELLGYSFLSLNSLQEKTRFKLTLVEKNTVPL
jgi:hypothetical protein